MSLSTLPNPKGIPSSSPGLRVARYPGSRFRTGHNPNGVASCVARPTVATPLGLKGILPRVPRVACASQPWALRRNPVGILQRAVLPDEIAPVLAGHYGFTAEELDIILNYDLKYRLGRSPETDEE